MHDGGSFTGNQRFQVLSLLGTGGMGVVYEALDRERDVRVAIKTLRLQGASRLLRFKQEFRALRDIRHPNLVELGELFEERGTWFFTMELVAGGNIRKYVRHGTGTSSRRIDSQASGTGAGSQSGAESGAASMVLASDVMERSVAGSTTELATTPWDASGELAEEFARVAAEKDAMAAGTAGRRRSGTVRLDQDGNTPPGVVIASAAPLPPPRFDEARLRSSLKGLGAGIAALHRAGKVHCDIKPPNVMVTPEGRVVVLDFGVVAEFGDPNQSSPRNAIIGSPAYMAPEQATGAMVGPAADWYGVGVILFELLTGRLPFMGNTPAEVVAAKLHAIAPDPGELVADLPDDLVSLCNRLLATAPGERPAEGELLDLLGIDEGRTRVTGSDRRIVELPVFVGRQRELDVLDAAYRASRGGRPVSVFVEGESGVGKSATVEHYLQQRLLGDPDVLILRGQCHEREFVPYNAFDGVIDDLGRFLRARYRGSELPFVPEGVSDLLDVFPVLRGVRGLAAHIVQEPTLGDPRSHAFAALRELLDWLAETIALVVIIHDVHWADADSLTLLSELMNEKVDLPLLFLATARKHDDGGSCHAVHAVTGDRRQIDLTGLSPGEAEELAGRLFERIGGGFVGDTAAIVAETNGHPLFMAELIRHMSALAQPDGSVRLYEGELDDALRSRAAALGRSAKDLLEIVAVAGTPLGRSVLAQALGFQPEDLDSQLVVLRDASLVRLRGAGRRATVAPYHDRVREAISEDLAPERRRSLHAALAVALEASGAPSIRLAVHFYHAGEMVRSAEHAVIAARHAAEVFAFDQAAELYSMAIVSGQHSPDDQRLLLNEMGMALQNAGRPREAAEAYMAAAEWADPVTRLELRRMAAQQLLTGGHMEQGIEVLADVLRHANMEFPADTRRAYMLVAWNLALLRVNRLTWKSVSEDQVDSDQLNKIEVCWTVATGFALADSVRAMVFGVKGARLALDGGEPFRIARATSLASVASAALGAEGSSGRLLNASERAATEHGGPLARVYVEIAHFTHAFFFDQSWRRCVEWRHEIERLWHSAGKGSGFELSFVIQFSSWAQSMLGDPRATAAEVDRVVRDAQRVGDRLLEVSMRVYHVLNHLAIDDPVSATRDVTEAIESWLPGRDVFQLPHAWALRSQGDIALYTGEPFMHTEFSMRFHRLRRSPLWNTIWTRGQGQYLQGRVALARAASLGGTNPTEAREQLRLAEQMARKLTKYKGRTQPLFSALIRAGLARVRGQDGKAIGFLRQAMAGFEAGESMLYAQVARLRLGQTLGGSEGEALEAEARTWMHGHGIVRPSQIANMYIPGW